MLGFASIRKGKHACLNRSTQPTQDWIALFLSENTTNIPTYLDWNCLVIILGIKPTRIDNLKGEADLSKIIYSMLVSLDGFVEGPDHNIDWGIIDEELHQYFNDQQAQIDTALYGRRMYEIMSDFWPTADADPTNPGYIIEFSRLWKKTPKVVFSKTLEKVEWNSRLVKEDFAGEIRRLKAQPGKTMEIGGANLAATFIKQDLIDEYQLYVQPVILGSGVPFFPALDGKLNLRLVETHRFGNGVVLLRYLR